MFPGLAVPSSQPSSRGGGWGSAAADTWLLDYQIFIPEDSYRQVLCTSDADASFEHPDHILSINVDARDGKIGFGWDDRQTGGETNTAADVITANRWHTIAAQKSAASDIVRVYVNGVLVLTETVGAPLPTLDMFRILPKYGVPILREFSVRTNTVLPEIPFGPGGVNYDVGDPHLRFNSYMP